MVFKKKKKIPTHPPRPTSNTTTQSKPISTRRVQRSGNAVKAIALQNEMGNPRVNVNETGFEFHTDNIEINIKNDNNNDNDNQPRRVDCRFVVPTPWSPYTDATSVRQVPREEEHSFQLCERRRPIPNTKGSMFRECIRVNSFFQRHDGPNDQLR